MANPDLELLKQLSDPFQDFIADNHSVLLYRGGVPYELSINMDSVIGLIVQTLDNEKINLPLLQFIEKRLINLPRLAGQIIGLIQKTNSDRSISPIDGPILFDGKDHKTSKDVIIEYIRNPRPFSTGIIQLMARAGQGKSVLLDMLALELAKLYTPSCGSPLLLNIDLLGRYVGTIEDAIAGTLNNNYKFPLSQDDVITCIKKRWIVLALDGFDELVARIGAKDAFQKLSYLVDQLDGNGTIIISARESFFTLYQIHYSSQSYFTPRDGSYVKVEATLKPWTKKESVKLICALAQLKNIKVNSDNLYENFSKYFRSNEELLSNPFFLTKLINLWLEDDNSFQADDSDDIKSMAKMQFVIEKYIERETNEKWKDREGIKISTIELHRVVLGYIAEELFRSSVQHLSKEEIQLCAEIALENLISGKQKEAFLERILVHSVFDNMNYRFSFSHIQYSNYYLSLKIVNRLRTGNFDEFELIYQDKELSYDVINWIRWLLIKEPIINKIETITILQSMLRNAKTEILRHNISIVIFLLLNKENNKQRIDIRGVYLTGNDLENLVINNLNILFSTFIDINLSETELNNIKIIETNISAIRFGEGSQYNNVTLDEATGIKSIILPDGSQEYSPSKIDEFIKSYNIDKKGMNAERDNIRIIDAKKKDIVTRMVKRSNKTYYFGLKEIIEEGGGNLVQKIGNIGLRKNILREKKFDASGTQTTIVTFIVDKQKLLQGCEYKIDDKKIDSFWDEVSLL
jgi:GR25 family glycosyltransferase involved in LPS biosynthesis